jgi:hypothetical protein
MFDGTTSTFTLSGSITGGSPGFNSGAYAFVTTYLGADTPTAGPNAPFAFANPADPEEFFYDSLAPSTSMVLDLFGTPTGDHVIPLATAGMFDGPGFSFGFVSPSCSGIVGCDQGWGWSNARVHNLRCCNHRGQRHDPDRSRALDLDDDSARLCGAGVCRLPPYPGRRLGRVNVGLARQGMAAFMGGLFIWRPRMCPDLRMAAAGGKQFWCGQEDSNLHSG